MKNIYFILLLLIATCLGLGIHYLEFLATIPKSNEFCPNGIPCYHDYGKGRMAAQKLENKNKEMHMFVYN